MLIQNDDILEIFQHFQEKLQQFWDHISLLRSALATEKIFGCRSNYKNSLFRFCNFTMLQKEQKMSLINYTEHW